MSGQRTRLYRRPDRGVLGGVCAGIGEYLGVDAVLVRVAVGLLVAAGGFGVALYALAWALIPAAREASAGEAAGEGELRRRLGRAATREALGAGLLVLAALLGLRAAGLWLGDALVWPVVLASGGLALIWRQSEASAAWTPAELRHPVAGVRARLRGEHGADGRRTLIGVVLVVLAAYSLLRSTDTLNAVGKAAGGILVLTAAVLLVLGPWLGRLARSLASERAERIRSQERAEVAAHLHDSVLQTLALIQKRAEDPREVAQLARQQERELRGWLADRPQHQPDATLSAALEATAQEVERLHRVPIEVVTVGDAPLDERLAALVQATREALANAAKFAGSAKVDVYAEVADGRVEVFVRDRGVGFDPAAIPEDRRGVRESILGRMERHGGHAAIHAAPGAGTEVELSMDVAGATAPSEVAT